MRTLVASIAIPLAVLVASVAAADEGGPREAAKHFQRGVSLYGEADYRAALVEFKRAYALSPNVAVLYNIGETDYQLQDYAGALGAFERFLAESSSGDPHRAEVDSNVEILRARVGHLTIVTVPPGADVTLDDVAVGKTPFEKALRVSIGHRRVVASMPGRAPVVREVDVAADDNVAVTLQLAAPSDASPAPAPPKERAAPAPVEPASSGGSTWRAVGWAATASFAAGAIASGILAVRESNELRDARNAYPASADAVAHDASLTTTYSVLADSLTAAAIVVGGITLFSSMSSSSSAPTRGSAGETRVVLGPSSARLDVTF